jgi:serine/threonine protein kinase
MPLKLIKSLGSGGFGNVELVEDESGQRFARKIFSVNQPLRPDLIDNVKKRFIREAKVQKGVVHRNIVPVLEEDLATDPPYFLMPPAEASLY